MNHRETMLNQFIIISTKKSRFIEGGFTLVELMVTIAVLAIIVSIAAPSMSRQLADSRVRNTASVIESSLKEAISESAIRRQVLTYSLSSSNITITDPAGNTIQSYSINVTTPVTISPAGVTSFNIGPGKKVRNTAGT